MTKKSFRPFIFLIIFFILFIIVVEYFDVEQKDIISTLDQKKELSKQEALVLAEELGCTRIVDLGDVYVPCSTIKEYEYALKIYSLKVEIQDKQIENLFFNALIFTIIIAIVTLLAFVLLQSKRHESLKINGINYLMPSEWVDTISSLENSIEDMSSKTNQTSENSEVVLEDFKSLKDIFLELQNKLNEQDKEIERLKKGYDNHLVKKFITRFLRVHSYLIKQNTKFPEDSNFQNLLMLMDDALESSNVFIYYPEIGGDYRVVEGLSENPELIDTSDRNKDYLIKSIIKPGYFIKYGESKEFVQDAVVSVYNYLLEEE